MGLVLFERNEGVLSRARVELEGLGRRRRSRALMMNRKVRRELERRVAAGADEVRPGQVLRATNAAVECDDCAAAGVTGACRLRPGKSVQ